MAEIEKTEFEFPDEIEDKKVNPREGGRVIDVESTEVEVVDDTPEADRNRKPMAEPPKELTDEELGKYDEGVRKRIQHFTKGYHEERRAKEAAQREREEAIRAAQAIAEENRRLQGSLSQGQAVLLEQAKKVVANEMTEAERKYKAAYEAGDAEALAKAQAEMTAIAIKADRVNNFKPAPVQPQQNAVQTQPQPPAVDPKAAAWKEKNPWFGVDEELTGYALVLHNKLVKENVNPTSDEYYRRVDTRMREVFPGAFESESRVDAQPQRQKSNVVSPATRSTAPRKVVLTKSQVEIAKRLGVPLELYARKVAEGMRNQNG